MNIHLLNGCPTNEQSILYWNTVQRLWADPIDPTDPPAFGTRLFKGGRGDLTSAFMSNSDSPSLPTLNPSPDLSQPIRRPLRVLLIGERQDVLATIQNLHKRGFADAGDWSIPFPYPQQNAVNQFIPRGLSHVVISVHTKYLN